QVVRMLLVNAVSHAGLDRGRDHRRRERWRQACHVARVRAGEGLECRVRVIGKIGQRSGRGGASPRGGRAERGPASLQQIGGSDGAVEEVEHVVVGGAHPVEALDVLGGGRRERRRQQRKAADDGQQQSVKHGQTRQSGLSYTRVESVPFGRKSDGNSRKNAHV